MSTNGQVSEYKPIDIANLPFRSSFRLLQDMPADERREILDSLHAPYFDCDRWEITVSVEHYDGQYTGAMPTMRLSKIPLKPQDVEKGDADDFNSWPILGENNSHIKIHPAELGAFLTATNAYRAVQPATTLNAATSGNLMMPVSMFTHCLREAGVSGLHVKVYGHKAPITPGFMRGEPADENHPLAHRNQWDISKTFSSKWMFMFAPAIGSRGIKKIPIFSPGSDDFGTIRLNTTYNGEKYNIKMYSLHAHVFKSVNPHPITFPKTMAGVAAKEPILRRILASYRQTPDTAMGGFRIEISMQAFFGGY